jgi:hypothetical protein
VSREVSVYSTDDREFALVAAHSRRREWCGFQKSAFDQIALCLRTALQQPPRPTTIARGKLSSRVCPNSNLPAPSSGLLHFRWVDLRGSLLFKTGGTRVPHREKFRHRITIPILLWVTTQQSLGKHRQRAHRRRFARSPRFSNRAGLKIVGAASKDQITQWGISRNRLISRAQRVLASVAMLQLCVRKASF